MLYLSIQIKIQSDHQGNLMINKVYVKYQSNIERHRNYITTHRVDDSYSALYAAHEDQFIKVAEGKDQGSLTETIYKMDKKEKVLLDNFLYVRNNGLNGRSFKILLIAGNLN